MKSESPRTPISPPYGEGPEDDAIPSANATASEPPSELHGEDAATLGKVRDLLFGEQSRDTDRRLRELETRLADAMSQLSRENAERMENLHQLLDAKLEDLQAHVANGEAQRQSESEAVSRRIEAMGAELSQRLASEAEILTQRISEHHRASIGHIDQAIGVLDERKTDREMMEQVFTEMASRIRGR